MQRLFILIVILFITGCSINPSNETTENSISIYTTIYPLQYITEQIAKDKATVVSVYPPGVDAHTYEPATKEVTEIANGDLFVYLGAHMESFAESVRNALELQPISFVSIEEEDESLFDSGNDSDDHHGDLDPHIWLDPNRMIQIGEIMLDKLVELSPDNATDFEQNFATFKNNMQSLDEDFHDVLDAKQNKYILVTHAAYGYWESAYDLEQIPISGISSSDEPSQKELTKIANTAKEQQLSYVIYEKNQPNKTASIVQDYIDAEKLEIHSLEVLTDEDIESNDDYISLMKENLNVLDEATN